MTVDDTDLELIALLQERGRISHSDLAKAVNLSLGLCTKRVRRLEADGLIIRYRAMVDVARVGPAIILFMKCTLNGHSIAATSRFERGVAAMPEVSECHLMSGGCDYLLRVVVRSVRDYRAFADMLMASDLDLMRYSTHVVLAVRKDRSPRLGALLSEQS